MAPQPTAAGAARPAPAASDRDARLAPAARLRRELDAVFDAPLMSHAHWGVLVRSLDSGETLYERNAGKLLMPASTMKLVTTAAAAGVLGWDARFTTTLETAAPVTDGALQGDLVVRGGGDPTIGEREGRAADVFDTWAAALRARGIARIAGRIVGDDDAFEDESLGAGWMWDDLQFPYAAPVGALQVNDGAAELVVRPGPFAGEPALVCLSPGSGLTVLNRAFTTPPGIVPRIDVRRHVDRPLLEVRGLVPLPIQQIDDELVAERPVATRVAVANPTLFFVQTLKDALAARGIDAIGEAADLDDLPHFERARAAADYQVLARTESPPLSEIATVLNKESQNQYAETLLKAMDVARGGRGSSQGGRAVVRQVLTEWGLDPAALVMADGSGMSRYNYLAPSLLAELLERMYRDPAHRDHFAATLPIAGVDGTLKDRLQGTRAEGNARAKTGSLANVRALSGYLRTRDGEALVFSIVANNFAVPGATATWIIDLAVEILANFSRTARYL